MSYYNEILGLRAIRVYRDEPISADDLVAILEAARWTGSSKNRQRWSFIVVRDPDQKARLAACGDFTDPIRAAPATLALVQESSGSSFDIGRAAQNVMLAADAIGVASCPITLHRDSDARAGARTSRRRPLPVRDRPWLPGSGRSPSSIRWAEAAQQGHLR